MRFFSFILLPFCFCIYSLYYFLFPVETYIFHRCYIFPIHKHRTNSAGTFNLCIHLLFLQFPPRVFPPPSIKIPFYAYASPKPNQFCLVFIWVLPVFPVRLCVCVSVVCGIINSIAYIVVFQRVYPLSNE